MLPVFKLVKGLQGNSSSLKLKYFFADKFLKIFTKNFEV